MPFTSLRARKPKHAKPSKAAPVLAVGGLTASFGAALTTTASAASDDDFARLRMCESGGNYSTNTGNGYYGAYQFDSRTWHGLGYSGLPSQASKGTQDSAAHELQAARGWQPWPACARKLGLGRDGGRDDTIHATRTRSVTIVKTTLSSHAPAWSGHVITTGDVTTARPDVRAWQARMRARGWDIKVDGKFGPRSAHVATRFAAEKRLGTPAGIVDESLWNAAWVVPVS
ncbi:MAG: Transglycosylase domain protein [Frankiales bacterium]|nr:Transglycosylase domain protein [Frankiales bacterium]